MAIKVIKSQPAYKNQGLLEVKLLRELAKVEKDIGGTNENYLNLFDAFIWKGHLCVAMEVLDNSILDICTYLFKEVSETKYEGIELSWI